MIIKQANFKDRLRIAMNEREMRPVELSKKTGIQDSTISQYLSGYAEPKQDKLILIANALDFNPCWLMGLDVPRQFETDTREISELDRAVLYAFNKADVGTQNSVLKLLDIKKTDMYSNLLEDEKNEA